MARAGAVVAEHARAARGAASSPASRRASSTRSPRSSSARSGGVPTFKGYSGYPAATCLSPNAMVVHGIPGQGEARRRRHPLRRRRRDARRVRRRLGLDVRRSATISPEAQRLLDVCQAALEAGIAQARVGNTIGDISARRPDGHRGRRLQRHPQPRRPRRRAVDARGPAGAELRLRLPRPGAPGGHDDRDRADDHGRRPGRLHPRRRLVDLDLDGSLAAHFEHTVAVTAAGPRILTDARVLVP